jgi:hypothetical protein
MRAEVPLCSLVGINSPDEFLPPGTEGEEPAVSGGVVRHAGRKTHAIGHVILLLGPLGAGHGFQRAGFGFLHS